MGVVIDPNSISSDAIMFAMLVVVTVPILLLFTGLQKYFVKGIVTGAVKG
jgi:ABC-type glycerol-3-phosphate transport system permease component